MGLQLATIPLTLGVVAAGLSDIDDRFSVRIMNLILYLYWFFHHCNVDLIFYFHIQFYLHWGLIVSVHSVRFYWAHSDVVMPPFPMVA